MCLTPDDHMVEAFTADRLDPTFDSQERVSANYVYRLLRLPTLAPDVITAIVNGKSPPRLTAKKLTTDTEFSLQ
jgi:hypothetical protein